MAVATSCSVNSLKNLTENGLYAAMLMMLWFKLQC